MQTVSLSPSRRSLLVLAALLFTLLTTACQAATNPDEELWEAAVVHGNVKGVHAALVAGAHPNARHPDNGQTAFMGAVLRGHTEVVDYLLNQSNLGVDVGIPEKDGFTPAHGAGFQGRSDILRLLWQSGRVNVDDDVHSDGYAPFHRACWGREERHTATLRVWRDEIGVDLSRPAANGQTCATMTSNPATLALLAEEVSSSGADLVEEEL
jgi:hypothetical protein